MLEEGGFAYSSDSYADDLPYWVMGPKGPHVIVPYTLDANDMRFVNAQGFAGSDEFFSYLRDAFDALYAEGADAPKMMSVGLHCRLVGRPGTQRRPCALPRSHRQARPRVGRIETRHRAALDQRASCARRQSAGNRMTQGISLEQLNSGARAEFVAALGDIFEHSPWVPEVAAAGRPFATLAELYESLKAALLKAGADRQLAVITAHPDLAGKAARAGTLTPELTAEQASAGLDRLSETEYATFHRLNEAYKARFGFPFIICVRRHTKDFDPARARQAPRI